MICVVNESENINSKIPTGATIPGNEPVQEPDFPLGIIVWTYDQSITFYQNIFVFFFFKQFIESLFDSMNIHTVAL